MKIIGLSAILILYLLFFISTTIADQSYGTRCDGIRLKCTPGLVCLNGKCDCRFSNHQIYDASDSTKKCQSLVRGPCQLSSSNAYAEPGLNICVPNAECTERLDGYKECQCKSGYVENPNGNCDLEFGADCSSISDMFKCDQLGPLYCRNGACACKDELETYDKESRKCKGGFGAFCEEKQDCFGDLECKKMKSLDRGQCDCLKGYCWAKTVPTPRPYPETTTTNWKSWITSTTRGSRDFDFRTTTRRSNLPNSTPRESYPGYRRAWTTTTTKPKNFGNFLPAEEEAEWIPV